MTRTPSRSQTGRVRPGPKEIQEARIKDERSTEGVWEIRGGEPRPKAPRTGEDPWQGAPALDYNNPYGYSVERVWFDGRVIFASEQGELDIDPERVKVAQEYQVVTSVELTADGKLRAGTEPGRVLGQLNIYDSIPGMASYSPIWQFNYVIVPADYVPNTLRSERDCRESGYEIRQSRVFEN